MPLLRTPAPSAVLQARIERLPLGVTLSSEEAAVYMGIHRNSATYILLEAVRFGLIEDRAIMARTGSVYRHLFARTK